MNTALIADISNKDVLIIGCPASGKTYLSNLLARPSHLVIHTDDFISKGYKDSIYHILEYITKTKKNTIVEGIQGYRLLRKGLELDCYYPEIVVELEITEARMRQTYYESRLGKSFESLSTFKLRRDKILNDYFQAPNEAKPLWYTIKNDY